MDECRPRVALYPGAGMKRNPRSTKVPYECVGGPLNCQVLYLESPSTLPFKIHGQSGRYRTSGYLKMRWEPAP